MNRRAFLSMLAAAADPERLLWTPGRKLISIPSVLVRIPECPFFVFPTFSPGGRDDQADVMNALLRSRWRRDEDFRGRVCKLLSLGDPRVYDIGRREIDDMRRGLGFYHRTIGLARILE